MSPLVALFAAALCSACGGSADRPAITRQDGSITDYVASFVAHIPPRGSGDYDIPTQAERSRLASAFRAAEAGRPARAAELAAPLGYRVVRFLDKPSHAPLLVLVERGSLERSPAHGWGLYVHALSSHTGITIEAPHPIADQHTEDVAAELFRATSAENLLVAGAHRYANDDGSADPAHRSDSALATVDRVASSSGDIVVQIHGFEVGEHPGYGNIVVSGAQPLPGPRVSEVAAGLRDAGYRVCLYDGIHCTALGATTNVEGAAARGRGVTFVHIELAYDLRANERERDRLVQRLAPLLLRTAG